MTSRCRVVLVGPLLALGISMPGISGATQSEPAAVIGRWNITVVTPDGEYPSWLEVQSSGTRTLVGHFVGRLGSARPISRVEFTNDALRFSVPPQWDQGSNDLRFEGQLKAGRLTGWMTDAAGTRLAWTAKRAPALRRTTPPEWRSPIVLFNGADTAGWQTAAGSAWRVVDHVLTNVKAGANLVTRQSFTDFQLHLEFRYASGANSGVYLRGCYEVQIYDSAGREPAKDHMGAVYGFLSPNEDAARAPGEWQTLDITLVGRLVSVVLNGKAVINRQEIPGITGGALDGDEAGPGPLMLQGDHGPVEFRAIVLTPAK